METNNTPARPARDIAIKHARKAIKIWRYLRANPDQRDLPGWNFEREARHHGREARSAYRIYTR